MRGVFVLRLRGEVLMEIIPAIDLRGGKCVRLTRGDYAQEKVYADDPVVQATKFKEMGAHTLHLVDLDGARAGASAHLEVIRRIRGEKGLDGLRIEFGGGIRNAALATSALDAGADMLIIGTAAFRDPAFLADLLSRMRDEIAVSMDVRDGKVMVAGWLAEGGSGTAEAALEELGKAGVRTVIYTDTSRDGTLEGVDAASGLFGGIMQSCQRLGIRLQYAGGVRDVRDVAALKRFEPQGLYAMVAGKALYEGTLDLAEAIAAGVA
jgi:phosphoribosylformimino-5-aminoimidazole carboxamide ribotide isomerase